MEPLIKTKLLIYISYLFILFLHFLFFLKFSEPYPSLIFPGFSKVPENKGEYIVGSNQIFAITHGNDTLRVNEKNFFKSVLPHHIPFLIIRLKTTSPTAPNLNNKREEFINYSIERLNEQYPKISFKSLMILDTKTTYKVNRGLVSKQDINQQKTFIELQ